MMQHRRAGGTDMDCSILGLGTGRLASVSAGVSRADAARLIDTAADLGVNLIDTADSYAQGWSERLLGDLLRGRRDKFLVATKAGYCFPDLPGALRMAGPIVKKIAAILTRRQQNFSPRYIEGSVEASLRRLNTDRLDIFYLHTPSLAAVKNIALLDVLRSLKDAGKIRHFGVSSHDPAVLESACLTSGLSVVQAPVNPCFPDVIRILPGLQAAGVGVVANRVFLSGKLLARDVENAPVCDRIGRLCAAHGTGAGRLLLQFALAQPGVCSALSGTVNAAHLLENAADVMSPGVLSPEELESLGTSQTA